MGEHLNIEIQKHYMQLHDLVHTYYSLGSASGPCSVSVARHLLGCKQCFLISIHDIDQCVCSLSDVREQNLM